MSFVDNLARDPTTEDEFWKIIEETFVQVEPTLTDYPVETREEALEPQRYAPGDLIRYRGASEDYDSRDDFLELGRKVLPRVKRQIKSRRLTPKFARDWGVVMMCFGFIAAHVLDDSDALSHVRAGLQSGRSRSRESQTKWIAHQLLPLIDRGIDRGTAEHRVAEQVKKILKGNEFPSGFNRAWFAPILTRGGLATTYDEKHLSVKKMRKFVAEPRKDIPPIFPWNSSAR
jgi:hypothetical protein